VTQNNFCYFLISLIIYSAKKDICLSMTAPGYYKLLFNKLRNVLKMYRFVFCCLSLPSPQEKSKIQLVGSKQHMHE